MYLNDSYGMKRFELGDKSCEVLFAIKKRCKDFNNPQLGPNMGTNQMPQPHIHQNMMATPQMINPLLMAIPQRPLFP
jgi:hypothetical protein